MMKIKDTSAKKIFKALGFQTADSWDCVRLQKKINKLPEIIQDDVEIGDEKLMRLVDRILDTIQIGKEVIVAKKKSDKKAEKTNTKKSSGKTKKSKLDKATGKKKKGGGAKKDKSEKSKKDKSKKSKSKATGTKKNKMKKVGVIATIVECLENGPVSKETILKKLCKRFPDRPEEGMKRTIGIQVPTRLRSDKDLDVQRNDKGKYYIA